MSCSEAELRDYLLGELSREEASAVEARLRTCASSRDELERLRLVYTALQALPDEEPPRRIAFVSDKVIQPSWWERFWASGPQMGFASAALVAMAILVHGAMVPAPQPVAAAPVAAPAAAATLSQEQVQAIINRELARVTEDLERKHQAQLKAVTHDLQASEERLDAKYRAQLTALAERHEYTLRTLGGMQLAANRRGAE